MTRYIELATSTGLTTIYLAMVAMVVYGVISNILRERRLSMQLVGGLVLIPLVLRLMLVK